MSSDTVKVKTVLTTDRDWFPWLAQVREYCTVRKIWAYCDPSIENNTTALARPKKVAVELPDDNVVLNPRQARRLRNDEEEANTNWKYELKAYDHQIQALLNLAYKKALTQEWNTMRAYKKGVGSVNDWLDKWITLYQDCVKAKLPIMELNQLVDDFAKAAAGLGGLT
ncbi:hypothetical protein VE00_07723 [Pseudogymnoascus sp. WSF 3629]|nr:hypothetical protein VE00_07723 [Pseudogymnoascus sp. WSF 3629]